MTRTLSYPVEITAAIAGPPHLFLPLSYDPMPPAEAAAHKAAMARTIPWNTVGGAVRLFAAAAGEPLPPPAFVDGEAIVIPLPAAAVAEPWRAAVLLNLVDFSVVADEEDLRLIKGASLRAPRLAGLTPETAFHALASRIEADRAVMTTHLPKGFWVDEYEKGNWPEVSDEYDFDLTLGLSRALTTTESAQIAALAEDGEMIVAWAAYATEGLAQAWVDSGKMIYSGETSAKGAALAWNASRPPTDFAPSLLLVEAALNLIGVSINRWDIEIQKGS
jgi:hypothetical protein